MIWLMGYGIIVSYKIFLFIDFDSLFEVLFFMNCLLIEILKVC